MPSVISGAVVLVTGANGGLGREFVAQALERGAAKVYATARTPREWNDARVQTIALDVTDESSVRAAAAVAGEHGREFPRHRDRAEEVGLEYAAQRLGVAEHGHVAADAGVVDHDGGVRCEIGRASCRERVYSNV